MQFLSDSLGTRSHNQASHPRPASPLNAKSSDSVSSIDGGCSSLFHRRNPSAVARDARNPPCGRNVAEKEKIEMSPLFYSHLFTVITTSGRSCPLFFIALAFRVRRYLWLWEAAGRRSTSKNWCVTLKIENLPRYSYQKEVDAGFINQDSSVKLRSRNLD